LVELRRIAVSLNIFKIFQIFLGFLYIDVHCVGFIPFAVAKTIYLQDDDSYHNGMHSRTLAF